MRALLLLPLQRLILSIRLWITEHIFHQRTKTNGSPLRVSLIIGAVCAGALLIYGFGLEIVGFSGLDYTDTSLYPSLTTLVGLLLYILLIICINRGLSSLRGGSKEDKMNTPLLSSWGRVLFIKELVLWALLIGGGYIFLGNTSIAPVIIYYLLVAASEEGLKRLSSISLFRHHAFSRSDLILFALLVSLGFAFLENIIYMLQRTDMIHSITKQLTGGTVVLVSRGLVGFLVHMLFTGTIAYISLWGITKKNTLRLFGALVGGIGLHMSYNVLLYYNITIVVGLYIVLGYFLLSWLFYHSDSVYLST